MAKYFFQASYVGDGPKGLIKEGGSERCETVANLVTSMGGTLESFYYAFGEDDVVAVADMPDKVSVAALSLIINASGAIAVKTTVLLTPEEIDQAARRVIDFRAPGK